MKLSIKLFFPKYLFGFGALLLLLGVMWGVFRAGSEPPRMAVTLVEVQDEPLTHWHRAPTVLNGGRGLCAIFTVTNLSTQHSIWFNTWALEKKVGAEWQRTVLPPYAFRQRGDKPCFLIDSDDVRNVYPPGKAWYYVVPWPSDIPTNAAWRLEVRYGRAPSALIENLDRTFDFTRRFFGFPPADRRPVEGTLMTPEVRQ